MALHKCDSNTHGTLVRLRLACASQAWRVFLFVIAVAVRLFNTELLQTILERSER